jgi:hypothetical protein
MKFYIAHIEDRHIDDIVEIFKLPENAVTFVKKSLNDLKSKRHEIEEEQIDGCIYCGRCGEEGTWGRVIEREVDGRIE